MEKMRKKYGKQLKKIDVNQGRGEEIKRIDENREKCREKKKQ